MKTRVEELAESKVRLEVEVPDADLKHAVEHAASDLAESIRVPGFRKGKVPPRIVAARVGREALLSEAVRSHIDGWFWNAAARSGIQPVASPELDFELPDEGETFRFTATVAVLPKPEVADWRTLEVPAPEPEVPSEAVDAELERLRGTVAELVPAGDRPARPGDTVVLDLDGDGVAQRDYVVEVGAGTVVDEIDQALAGMAAGETKPVEFELPDGSRRTISLTVKDVKEKVLPELDDELARSASEFETLPDLRADIEARLAEQLAVELDARFREAAADALVAASRVERVEPLVERRAADLAQSLARSLEARGIPLQTYLTMTGRSQEELVARLREEAERSVKRELVLDALADELGLEVSDEEVETLVREQAEAAGEDANATLAMVRDRGAFESLRADLRLSKALDEVVAGVKRIPVDLANARDKLWTPEQEKGTSEVKIWTPGSEEGR